MKGSGCDKHSGTFFPILNLLLSSSSINFSVRTVPLCNLEAVPISLSTHLSGQNCPWHRKKILKYTTYSRDFLPCQRQFSLVSPHTLANGTASKSLFHISKYAGWRKIFPPDQANFRRNTGCISRKFNAVWRQKARQPAC